jgi:hypothetical protein
MTHPLDAFGDLVAVLADLLGSADFPAEVMDPEAAAKIILQRLVDAGFKVVPARRFGRRPPDL